MDRVQKIIAHAGICSRRDAEELIEQGHVTVNGKPVELGAKAGPDDTVKVKGRVVKREKPVHYMLHKPKGVVTTTDDPHGRPYVTQLIHDDRRIFPVGRLDKDTSGLLLLTNDGDFANRVMHPRYEVTKTYIATLDGKVTDDLIRKINDGVRIDGRKIRAKAKKLSNSRVEITVHTGMNKEVKRIFKELGYWVRELHRTHIGKVKLDVKPGKFRKLTRREIESLS